MLGASFDEMRKWYARWDRISCRPFRIGPSSKYLLFLRPLRSMVAYAVALVWFGLSKHKDEYTIFRSALMCAEGRIFFRTEQGYTGFAPDEAKEGDLIYVVKGCRTPMILRRSEDDNRLTLVGDCYLHGFMTGDKFSAKACQSFWLS